MKAGAMLALKRDQTATTSEVGDVMQNLRYAVFGLGNKQYEHFNATGKAVHRLLLELGGLPIAPLGLGDDDSDISDDYDAWLNMLMASVEKQALLQRSAVILDDAGGAKRGYTVRLLPAGATLSEKQFGEDASDATYVAQISAVRNLHAAGAGRSCVHVDVDLGGANRPCTRTASRPCMEFVLTGLIRAC
jgi:NADPH-ferrihemoprotein reductase